MKINPSQFTVEEYLHKEFDCECGRKHGTDLRDVVIESGAISRLPKLIAGAHCNFPMVVCDTRTMTAAGQCCIDALKSAEIKHILHIIAGDEIIPNEAVLGELLMAHRPQVDLLIAVGTGTINDLCKYLSYHLGIPYIVVATAPSMDGFASIGAALITDNLKTTYDTHVPIAIIGDVEVLKNAPMDMITAGLGDILGKYTCLTDWKLAKIVTHEYYCPVIAEMVEQSIQRVVANAGQVLQRDPFAITAIMEALVVVGVAMSFVGNSRPASGSEHHISHYWEMCFLFAGRKPVLHGTKVGIGTVLSCYLYNRLKVIEPNFDLARQSVIDFDYTQWEKEMHRTFLQAADGVIELEKKTDKNSVESHRARIEIIQREWPQIIRIIEESIPSTGEIIDMLSHLGAPTYPVQVGVDSKMVSDSVVVAKEVRDRYTILQLLWDLGLSRQEAENTALWMSEQTG